MDSAQTSQKSSKVRAVQPNKGIIKKVEKIKLDLSLSTRKIQKNERKSRPKISFTTEADRIAKSAAKKPALDD